MADDDIRIEDGQRVRYTSTNHRLPGGMIVTTQTRQPVHSHLYDLMRACGISDDELSFTAQTWVQPFDPLTAPCWWQWREPCDCPGTTFGRNPHRWSCPLTPAWRNTVLETFLDPTNSWALPPIPQIEAWQRTREARSALLSYIIALGTSSGAALLGLSEPELMRHATLHHPLTLTADWGTATEADYYQEAAR